MHASPAAATAHFWFLQIEEEQSSLALHCSPVAYFAGGAAHLLVAEHAPAKHDDAVAAVQSLPVGLRHVPLWHSPPVHPSFEAHCAPGAPLALQVESEEAQNDEVEQSDEVWHPSESLARHVLPWQVPDTHQASALHDWPTDLRSAQVPPWQLFDTHWSLVVH